MTCDFDKKSPEFWTKLMRASSQDCPTQIKNDFQTIQYSAINFPSINTQTIREYFIYEDNANPQSSRKTIVFKCCIFEDFEALDIDAILMFEGCTFEKKVDLASSRSGKGFKFKRTKFLDEANIAGTNSSICQLELIDCSFEKVVKLSKFDFLKEKSQVTGTFSSKFNSIRFSKCLVLEESNFQKELLFNSVIWPKKIIANRDICRQLKVCMEEQKNVLQANVFHSLEMDEYRRELSWKRLDDWQDLFVFTVNKIISNNTLSWLQPLLWIMVVSYIFYSMVCGWDAIFTCGWNGFFSFMSPLNRTPELYQSVYALWFIHKVVMVILVYHLVVALKRKTKFG